VLACGPGAEVGGSLFSTGSGGSDLIPLLVSPFQLGLQVTKQNNTDGGCMKKLLGALTLAMFLCVSGAAYAQDTTKKDDAKDKKEDSKEKKHKKNAKKKDNKEDKKEEKKDDKKPS